ncbi:MAG TPA: ABC transporter permease [Symbiobacteriaceae bacterium]|jgi:peptide/nickel transport system permease protein/oligopeptide transport system permease protein
MALPKMTGTPAPAPAPPPADPEADLKTGPTRWTRFRRHKLALVGMAVIGLMILIAILAPLLAPADPDRGDLFAKLARAGSQMPRQLGTGKFLMGADYMGRDLLSRLLYGARISLLVGFVAEAVILAIGVPLGAIAGYYGGKVDKIIMRTADVMFAFPDLLFAIAIMFALGSGVINLFIALGFVGWAGMARLVRGQVLQVKERDFVEAARASGAPNWLIIIRHILPSCLGPVIVAATLGIPGAIMSEAALSYLGLGVQPPTATWGSMINDGRGYLLHAPILSIAPGLAIMLTVLSFNLVGDGLRDAFDPRSNK